MVGAGPLDAWRTLGAAVVVKLGHALEYALLRAVAGAAGLVGWRAAQTLGATLGALVGAIGIRRKVALDNLARAFPERSEAERRSILARHYREVGRVALVYPRLGALARAPAGQVIAAVRGEEHLVEARRGGRGVVLLSGHLGPFELLVAWLAQRHPIDIIVRPMNNPAVDAWVERVRVGAGLGVIRADAVRDVYAAIRGGRVVGMLADQDARRHGVFVPFLGTPASTPVGPARIALALKVPIITAFCLRRADGRLEMEIQPPLLETGDDEAAALRLTARHTERLEEWVRRHPEMWFWLHRRWKTAPPEPIAATAAGGN